MFFGVRYWEANVGIDGCEWSLEMCRRKEGKGCFLLSSACSCFTAGNVEQDSV